MQIVTTTGSRNFKIIPRINFSPSKTYELKITSEQQNKVVFTDSTASFTGLKYYYNYALSETLLNNNFYTIEINNLTDSSLEFRDKIFCTNQTVSDFSMSKNVYVEAQTGNNEYVYYGE
tara:strand:- start:1691 stop:2047 length:357 start_codon:yes stop_codon:yes gene_type:complete